MKNEERRVVDLDAKDVEVCLEKFRGMAKAGFDGEIAKWWLKHKVLSEKFVIEHFDLLTPAERMKLYVLVFGFFRESFQQLMDARLKAEEDSDCREELERVERVHRAAFEWKKLSKAEQLAVLEKKLDHASPLIRCLTAMDIYELTGKSEEVMPVFLEILRDKGCKERKAAVIALHEVKHLTQEAIGELRVIAQDTMDPLQAEAKQALRRKTGVWNWILSPLRLSA